MPSCIRAQPDGVLLSVKVQPRASRNEVAGVHVDALKIRLTAPPVEGAANAMCVQFLAQCLGLPRSRLEIISGFSSRNKQLRIHPDKGAHSGQAMDRLRRRLADLATAKKP